MIDMFQVRDPVENYPSWFTKSESSRVNKNVLTGRHPMGMGIIIDGETCGTCKFIVSIGRNKTYLKCAKSRQTKGPATDIRRKWPACVLWEKP